MSRFSSSSKDFYATVAHNRPATSEIKNRSRFVSTGSTLKAFNTSEMPRPSTGSLFGRSTSSSFRNTKGKLQTLSQRLNQLLNDVQDARTDAKEQKLKLDFLKEELNVRGLEVSQSNLVQEIKKLDKAVKISKRSDMLKFEALQDTCRALGHNGRSIATQLHTISDKIYQLQNLLGFHGVREKLKY